MSEACNLAHNGIGLSWLCTCRKSYLKSLVFGISTDVEGMNLLEVLQTLHMQAQSDTHPSWCCGQPIYTGNTPFPRAGVPVRFQVGHVLTVMQ